MNRNNYRYNDIVVVKDNYEFYLYINDEKIAFSYKSNMNMLPNNLKLALERILKMTGELYDIPGI